MKKRAMVLLAVFIVNAFCQSGCVVPEREVVVRERFRPEPYWVPPHLNAYGYWVPGHWR